MSAESNPAYVALVAARTLVGWWSDIEVALIGVGRADHLPAGPPMDKIRWLLRQDKRTRAQVASAIIEFYPTMAEDGISAFRFLRDREVSDVG